MAKPLQMSENEKKKILEKLEEKGVRSLCPMCGHNHFILAEGYFNHSIQAKIGSGMVLGGPSIPTIAIFCSRCGFTSQHALGALGLIEPVKGAEK